MSKKTNLQELAKTLEDFRAWRNPHQQFLSQVDRINGFIGDLDANPGLYDEFRTSRVELDWLRKQEQLRRARYHVTVMRNSHPDGCNLPPTIERLREAERVGVNLAEAGTSLEEINGREREYRVATAKKNIENLRDKAYYVKLEEIDREIGRVNELLYGKGVESTSQIRPEEAGTSAAELASLRKPALFREAAGLLDKIEAQIQWDRNTGRRFDTIRKLLVVLGEDCTILGVTPERFAKLEETGKRLPGSGD